MYFFKQVWNQKLAVDFFKNTVTASAVNSWDQYSMAIGHHFIGTSDKHSYWGVGRVLLALLMSPVLWIEGFPDYGLFLY